MSRALDKDAAALLATSDPADVYRQISGALVRPVGEGLLEIEILGRGHPVAPGTYFLQDGNAIAVPKLALVQAFVAARSHLLRYLERRAAAAKLSSSSVSEEDVDLEDDLELAAAATAVILLMDPEHLTAANTRKRLLLRLRAREEHKGNHLSGYFADVVRREMRLVDSLLTSRLHRHTKSPTLWSHRRWLVQTCLAPADLPVDVYCSLVDVVMVSAERHPRNYYAWCHARWLVENLTDRGGHPPSLGKQTHAAGDDRDLLFRRIFVAAKDWALNHHADTSGWSFLWFLLASSPSCSGTASQLGLAALLETTKLSASLRWTNESVWVFLRTVVAAGLGGPDGEESFRSATLLLRDTLTLDSPVRARLQRAEDWVSAYRVTATSTDPLVG